MSGFEGKVILVTGGNRGLGLAIAEEFAKAGATVFVAGRNAAACEQAASRIEETAGKAFGLTLDVNDAGSAKQAVAEVENRAGGLDIVVNNAALVGPLARIGDADPELWRQGIETNVVGPFNVIQAALPLLLARRGIVVNISAGAADNPQEGMSAYCAGKAGLAMLTRALVGEYGGSGLRAYGFRPGMLDTDMQTEIRESRVNKLSDVARDTLNKPAVPARAVLALCGDAGIALSGSEIVWNDKRLAG